MPFHGTGTDSNEIGCGGVSLGGACGTLDEDTKAGGREVVSTS